MPTKTRQQLIQERQAARMGYARANEQMNKYLRANASRETSAQLRTNGDRAVAAGNEERAAKIEAAKKNVDPLLRGVSTVGRIKSKVLTGALGSIEGIIDLGIGAVGAVGGLFSEDFREGVQDVVEYNATNEWVGKHLDELTKYSYTTEGKLGEIVENVASGVGQMLPAVAVTVATGGAGAPAAFGAKAAGAGAKIASKAGMLTTMAGAAGGSMQEAYADGADYYEGLGYGVASGAVEGLTEKLTGGVANKLTGFGKGILDKAAGNVAKQGAARVVKDAVGEGVEEMLAEVANPALKAIYKGKDALSEYGDPEFLGRVGEAGLIGAATSVAFGGTVGKLANRGGNADVNVSLDAIKEIEQTAEQLHTEDKLTGEAYSELQQAVGKNYQNIEKVLKKASPEKRAKLIERYGLDGQFDSDGSIKADFAARNGFAVEGEQTVTETSKTQQGQFSAYQSPSLTVNRDSVDQTMAQITEELRQKDIENGGTGEVQAVERFDGELDEASRSAYSQFKKAFRTLNQEAGGKLSYVLVKPNSDFDGVRVGNTVYVSADTLANGSWKGTLIHEITHATEGTKAYDKYIALLEKDEKLVESAMDTVIHKKDYGFSDELAERVTEKLSGANSTVASGTQFSKAYAKDDIGGDEKHSHDVLNLSGENELSQKLKGVYGSKRYRVIQEYILDALGDQPIKLSDGKMAIVDNRDASHIANKAADKKTAQISKIKELVERAALYAEDKNPDHDKFNYFCYYKADVRYDDEVFPIYLNVGRGKNDAKYHVYDITNKLRDTADRINGLERPKPNEGYALTNGISNDSIPDSEEKVNRESENFLTDEEQSFVSEMGAHMSEQLLGTDEAFIERLVRNDTTMAERALNRITDLGRAFASFKSPEARSEYRRLRKAEQLYLRAISAAGMTYRNGKITRREEEEPEYSKAVAQDPAKKFSEVAVSTALYDALDHKDNGDDNLIRVSRMPRYVTENFGIDGDFYVYRDHVYENMVSRQQAEADGRPTQRGGKNIHFHDLGVDRMTDAILSLNEPIMTVRVKSHDGNPTVVMMLPVEGDNGAPLYAVLSFYSDRPINGRFERKPHIVLTISPREYFESEGARKGWAEFVSEAVKENRVLDYNKKGGYDLSVIAQQARLGNITEASLKNNIAQFRQDVNTFREKNKISYSKKTNSSTASETSQAMKQISDEVRQNLAENYVSKTAGQKAYAHANQNQGKVYTKQDAKEVIHSILENRLDFGEFKGKIKGKTRERAINQIWTAMNQAPAGKRGGVALDLAEYILQSATLENVYEDPALTDRQQIAMERLELLRPYFHRIDLEGIRGEIKYRFDDRSKSVFSTFGRWQGRRALGADQVAQELREQGWQITEGAEADEFFEIYDGYLEARRILQESKTTYLNQTLTKKERETLKQEIAKEILRGFDNTGSDSALNKTINRYEKIIDGLKEKLKENRQLKENLDAAYQSNQRLSRELKKTQEVSEKAKERANTATQDRKAETERNKLIGNLMNHAQKMKDLKTGAFLNASQYKGEEFRSTIEQLAKVNWRGNLNVAGTRKLLAGLRSWYSTDNPMLMDSEGKTENSLYCKSIAEGLDTLTADLDKPLTNDELRYLSETVFPYFIHVVEKWNKVYVGDKYVEAMPLAKRYVEGFQTYRRARSATIRNYMKLFGDPAALMRYADGYNQDGFFTSIFESLREGAIGSAVTEKKLMMDWEALFHGEGSREFRKHLEKGTVKLGEQTVPLRQAIALYMTCKRKQAWAGLCRSGFHILNENGDQVPFAALQADSDQKLSDKEMEQLTAGLAQEIYGQLSARDRKLIDVVERTFAECSKLKEQTDNVRYGFSNVMMGYYFPIRRADVAKNVEDFFAELETVSNLGFNKNTVQGASGALLIEPIDTVFTRHVSGISKYSNLAVPIDSFNRLLNLNTIENSRNPLSVLSSIKSDGFDKEILSYLKELKNDISGVSTARATTKGFNRLVGTVRSGWAKFQLGANAKVWLTQGSSFFAATGMLDYGCVVRGLGVPGAKEVDKYCDLAMLRNADNTVALAQGVLEKTGKLGDVTMKPIGWMDRLVITRLFGACQLQVQKDRDLKLGTEENKKAAGELLTRVILETQQNSLATERSAAMRSDSEILKSVTMFSADSMKVFARVFDSAGELKALNRRAKENLSSEERTRLEKRRKQVKRQLRKSVGALVTTSLFMATLAYGFQKLYRKDDEEKDVAETVRDMALDFFGNMLGGLPVLRGVYSFFADGYELEDFTFSALNDTLQGAGALRDLAVAAASGEEISRQELASKSRQAIYAACQLFGIPVRNVYNLVAGVTGHLSPTAGYQLDSLFYNKSYRADLKQAIEDGDEKMVGTIAGLITDEAVGDVSKTVRSSMRELVEKGYTNVLPRSLGDTVTYDGETVELTAGQKKRFRAIYDIADESMELLVTLNGYRDAEDEVKAKAMKFIQDTYYYLAMEDLMGVENGKRTLFAEAIDIEKLALIVSTADSITADKDRAGKVIQGSRKKKVVEYIESLRLTAAQKHMVLGYLGYRQTNGEAKVRAYINTLNLSQTEKSALLKYSGYAA